jgi:hypothetical protein
MDTINTNVESAAQAVPAVPAHVVTEGGVDVVNAFTPEGLPKAFKHSYFFRSVKDTPENREAIEQLGAVEESEEDEVKTIRRATETYTFNMPEIATGDPKLDLVMWDIIRSKIVEAAQTYVKKGEAPDHDKLSWPAIVDAIYLKLTTASAGDDSGSGFNSALLKEVAGKFSAYMKAIGRDEKGTELMAKMVTGRFSIITTHKYIKGLNMVKANIENWYLEGLNEEEQAVYEGVVQYLTDRCVDAMTPKEVETGTLFG